MRSEATAIADYFNAHTNLTADAGAVLFGNAVTITRMALGSTCSIN